MADRNIFEYDGKDAQVKWHGKLCIHVGECGKSEGDLFDSGRKPWCQPDLVPLRTVRDVISRCPTGALSLHCVDDAEAETPAEENTVTLCADGPLYVRGDLQIEGAPDSMPGVRYRAALCRCGQSANKPFCDSSHVAAHFRDSGAVGSTGPGVESTGGPLQIKPAKDGPNLLTGNFAIRAATGRAAWHGKKAALCRCGGSKNKPFCDGTHARIGFRAE